MKFRDTLKLSFHSIYHNKIRTLITVVIVFVVSLLIMTISILGWSFYKSLNGAYIDLFDEVGARFELSSYVRSSKDGDYEYRGVNYDEYKTLMNAFEPYPELIDNVLVGGHTDSYYLYDIADKLSSNELKQLYEHSFNNKYRNSDTRLSFISVYGDLDTKSKGISYLKSGRLWNKDDEGKGKVWVSEGFIVNAASMGNYLGVGDSITILLRDWKNNGKGDYVEVYGAEKLEIAGIFLNSALKEMSAEYDIFLDVATAYNFMGDNIRVDGIYIESQAKTGYVFKQEFKKMNAVTDKLNASIKPSRHDNNIQLRFRCDLIDYLKEAQLIGLIINGAAIFICFIILLISIGSVANSVMISVDKNKKFFGVMMAVGLKGGGVKRVVQMETLLIIMMSTGLAYGVLRLLSKYFLPVINFLMELPGFLDSSVVSMPIYIPLITVFVFVIMALLFTRRSLSKIVKMDVISVISEVS